MDVLAIPAVGEVAAPTPLMRPEPSAALLDEAAALLTGAVRPLILADGGAGGPVERLAEALDAPVVMTTNGRGLLP